MTMPKPTSSVVIEIEKAPMKVSGNIKIRVTPQTGFHGSQATVLIAKEVVIGSLTVAIAVMNNAPPRFLSTFLTPGRDDARQALDK